MAFVDLFCGRLALVDCTYNWEIWKGLNVRLDGSLRSIKHPLKPFYKLASLAHKPFLMTVIQYVAVHNGIQSKETCG
jgi:hypothetical protein